jgi:hypothetical protein
VKEGQGFAGFGQGIRGFRLVFHASILAGSRGARE